MGISTSLYLPAIGTAGLLLLDVSGNNLVPAPPPKITANVDLAVWKLLFLFALGVDKNLTLLNFM